MELQDKYNLIAEACRSGAYPVGSGSLSRDGCFCILGVVCEVAINNGVRLRREVIEQGSVYTHYIEEGAGGSRHGGSLPDVVAEWLETDPEVFRIVYTQHDIAASAHKASDYEVGLFELAEVMGVVYSDKAVPNA